ncbi:DUF1254 domain-containing protein [Bordetella holmesii]|uniref:DUF1254 domain-containing protein n=1 Tax=Bordetella holmesii TaxID=35814 RepID=UPI0014635672|nr:DUF1254 domain-containing protein [Bordetella holmesii]QJP61723.1 DUF1254 domain-containing protein [Bordetella holmesii]
MQTPVNRKLRGQAALVASVLGIAALGSAHAQDRSPTSTLRLVSETPYPAANRGVHLAPLSAQELRDLAVDAYVYAYPMVLMEVTRRQTTNVQSPVAGRAPMNQFGHRTSMPDARTADVAWPSTDSLYSSLWYDVSTDPLIVQVPDAGERFVMLNLLDMWTDSFATRGTRANGRGPQTFAIVGPSWQGTLPAGVDLVRSPTATGWLIGRVQAGGANDAQAMSQFQAGLSATPLNQYGRSHGFVANGPVNTTWNTQGTPAEQVANMDAATFFTLFSELVRNNPPHANDYPMLDRLRRIGIGDRPLVFGQLEPVVQQALNEAQPLAGRRIADGVGRLSTQANNWNTVLSGIGTYGTDYLRRASVAYAGLGASPPEEVIYPVTGADNKGRALESGRDYVLHFDKGQLPPVDGFWSINLYDARQGFAENSANRYTLRSSDPLKYNSDGSLDIYIRRDHPGESRMANWLPAPREGNFLVNMRLYAPNNIALDGQWAPPPIVRD